MGELSNRRILQAIRSSKRSGVIIGISIAVVVLVLVAIAVIKFLYIKRKLNCCCGYDDDYEEYFDDDDDLEDGLAFTADSDFV